LPYPIWEAKPIGTAVEMMEWQRDHAVTVESQPPEARALQDKIIIGVLVDKELPVYQNEYDKIRERAKRRSGDRDGFSI